MEKKQRLMEVESEQRTGNGEWEWKSDWLRDEVGKYFTGDRESENLKIMWMRGG